MLFCWKKFKPTQYFTKVDATEFFYIWLKFIVFYCTDLTHLSYRSVKWGTSRHWLWLLLYLLMQMFPFKIRNLLKDIENLIENAFRTRCVFSFSVDLYSIKFTFLSFASLFSIPSKRINQIFQSPSLDRSFRLCTDFCFGMH